MWAVISCTASLWHSCGKQEKGRRKRGHVVLPWCVAEDWWFWEENSGGWGSSFLFCWQWLYVPVTQNQWYCICVCLCWSLWHFGLSHLMLLHGTLEGGVKHQIEIHVAFTVESVLISVQVAEPFIINKSMGTAALGQFIWSVFNSGCIRKNENRKLCSRTSKILSSLLPCLNISLFVLLFYPCPYPFPFRPSFLCQPRGKGRGLCRWPLFLSLGERGIKIRIFFSQTCLGMKNGFALEM